ncbi:NmrA-like family domain-containing protein 1 [Tolypocladium ophioglossoides CBS 100239]|uniref:NmrA-like family domain-containing protein 1 n=1 Tax=Tolypocladium ophioglossoides (strain CBS 100239) TaxID=1163406 RepID=A0A0L0N2S5_TOLOC|nr:NmrA-like family domain-containing protein 1 [Tolypocladium ophioglossoides CBS 100239]
MSKILTVFGATGNQGSSVIRAVLADPVLSAEFKIRGITRNVSKPAAKALAAQGVEVVKADMSSVEAAAPAVEGAHTVFLVTNFWESMSADTEIAQGKAVTDASKAAGVKHLVFSSLINVTEASKGKLPNISHFDGKASIEAYIRGSGVPATFVLPGMFMSGFVGMIRKQDDGSYSVNIPEGVSLDNARTPLFDVAADTGKFVKAAIKTFPASVNKHIYAATDYYSPARLLSEFSEVMGKPARARTVSQDTFKSFLPPPAAQELLENWLLLESPGYYGGADLSQSLALLDEKPTSWKDFVAQNKAMWL